jgi:hypothetical protein
MDQVAAEKKLCAAALAAASHAEKDGKRVVSLSAEVSKNHEELKVSTSNITDSLSHHHKSYSSAPSSFLYTVSMRDLQFRVKGLGFRVLSLG